MAPSRLSRFARRLRRLFGTALLLGLVLVIGLAFPWSPDALRRKVAAGLSARIGCPVTVERATLWPLWGQLALRNVRLDYAAAAERFAFTGLERPAWTLGEAVISVRLGQLLRRGQPGDLYIALGQPDPLVLGSAREGLEAFPPIREILERQARLPRSRKWRLASLFLDRGRLDWAASASSIPAERHVVLSRVRCSYALDSETPAGDLSVTGRLGPAGESPFQMQVVQQANRWVLQLDTEAIRIGEARAGAASTPTALAAAQFRGQLQRRRGDWDFRLDGYCPRLVLFGVAEEATSLTVTGSADTHTSRGTLALALVSRSSRIDAAAEILLNGTGDSQTTLSIERLGEGWLALWNRLRSPQWPEISGRPERLAATAAGRLLRHKPWIADPHGHLLVAGLDLTSDYLPFAIHNVELEGAAAPDVLEIRRLRGQWPQGRVSLHGSHRGAWWGRWNGTTRLAWDFALRAEDLATTLPARAEARATTRVLTALAKRPFISGELAGAGTLALGWEDPQRPGALTTRTLQGAVTVRRGRLEHPVLPAPVTDLEGRFEVSPPRLTVRSVRGRLAGTAATIDATVEGDPFFWVDPQVRCLIRSDASLAALLPLVPEHLRSRIEAVEPRGRLAAELSLSGPIRPPLRPDDLTATGTLQFRDVAFRSPSWAVVGDFHDLRGRVEYADGILRLTTATGRLDEIPFTVQGEAAPEAGRLSARLESSAPFAALQQALPRALHRFQVGGRLSGWFELDATGDDLFAKLGRLRDLTSDTLSHLPFQWGLRGEVTAHDAQLTFETFPTSLTALNGRMSLRNFDWTFDDLTSSWGKTDQCRISGGGQFRPGSWPRMHLELDAPVLYLDEWIRPWRRARPNRFPPRVANPVFEMTGVVRGLRAYYRGHPGENVHGEFRLVSPYRRPDRFLFSRLGADLYGGQLNGGGDVVFQRGNSTCTLELAAKNVSLPPFLQCETGREQTFEGRLTGDGRFVWLDGGGDSLRATGTLAIAESKFLGNVFFRNLGRLIHIPFLDNVAFAAIQTSYRIAHRRVALANLAMDGPLMSMSGEGSAGFDHSLDFQLELALPRLPSYAWPLDLVVQSVGKVPSTALSLDLRGSWDDPQYGFHHLDAAEQGVIDALEKLWSIVTPGSPGPPPRKD